MDRIVIFGDFQHYMPVMLTEGLLDALEGRDDMVIFGICDTSTGRADSRVLRRVRHGVRRWFDPEGLHSLPRPTSADYETLFKRVGCPMVHAPGNAVNDAESVRSLLDQVRPTVGLSIVCSAIFRQPLMERFDYMVNYHTGLLPAYRGLCATGWSLYNGEQETGYTFHRIDAGIDTGPVLVQGAIAVGEGLNNLHADYRKAERASRDWPEVMACIARRKEGILQEKGGAYFGRRALRAVRRIDRPSELTWEETQRRLRAFDNLWMRIGETWYPVTELREAREGGSCSYRTRDGVGVSITRCRYVPTHLYHAYARTRSVVARQSMQPAWIDATA